MVFPCSPALIPSSCMPALSVVWISGPGRKASDQEDATCDPVCMYCCWSARKVPAGETGLFVTTWHSSPNRNDFLFLSSQLSELCEWVGYRLTAPRTSMQSAPDPSVSLWVLVHCEYCLFLFSLLQIRGCSITAAT